MRIVWCRDTTSSAFESSELEKLKQLATAPRGYEAEPHPCLLARRRAARQEYSLFLHLECAAVESGDHCLHIPVLRDVGVRALVELRQEGRGRHPLSCNRVPDCRADFGVEMNPLQAAIFDVLAEAGKKFADRRAPLRNRAAWQVDLGVFGILRDQSVPVAFVKRIQVFVQHGLDGWLLF